MTNGGVMVERSMYETGEEMADTAVTLTGDTYVTISGIDDAEIDVEIPYEELEFGQKKLTNLAREARGQYEMEETRNRRGNPVRQVGSVTVSVEELVEYVAGDMGDFEKYLQEGGSITLGLQSQDDVVGIDSEEYKLLELSDEREQEEQEDSDSYREVEIESDLKKAERQARRWVNDLGGDVVEIIDGEDGEQVVDDYMSRYKEGS